MMHGGGGGWGGGGGGVGGGLNRGAGPGMLANVADVDGAVYNPRVTRRALAYVLPHRWGVAFALAMTVAQAALMTIGPVWTKVAIDDHVATGDIVGTTLFLGLTVLAYFAAFLANWAQMQVMTNVGQRLLQTMRSLADMVVDTSALTPAHVPIAVPRWCGGKVWASLCRHSMARPWPARFDCCCRTTFSTGTAYLISRGSVRASPGMS